MSQAIARAKALTKRELDTIFWTNCFLAAAYALVIVVAAPLAERLFDAPQLAAVLTWLAIPVVLSGAGNTHMALRLREFGHKTLAYRSVLAGLLGGICAVVAALLGAGIWALVLQRVVREIVCTALAWSSYRWRPGIAFDFAEARRYLKNGIDLGLAQVVTLLSFRAQDLGIARVLGPATLSSYRVAWRCAELIGPQVVGPLARLLYRPFRASRTISRICARPMCRCCSNALSRPYPRLSVMRLPARGWSPPCSARSGAISGTIAPMLLPFGASLHIERLHACFAGSKRTHSMAAAFRPARSSRQPFSSPRLRSRTA